MVPNSFFFFKSWFKRNSHHNFLYRCHNLLINFLWYLYQLASSPWDFAFKVNAIMQGINKAVGCSQGGQRVLGHVCTVHQLQHCSGIVAHIMLKDPIKQTQKNSIRISGRTTNKFCINYLCCCGICGGCCRSIGYLSCFCKLVGVAKARAVSSWTYLKCMLDSAKATTRHQPCRWFSWIGYQGIVG